MNRSWSVLLLVSLLGACAANPPVEQLRAALPATYVGALPCADCPGLDYTLQLRADGNYFLRRDYRERGAVDEIGRWVFSSDQTVLALQGGEQFEIDSADRLTLRDRNAAPIVSSHNYSLLRSDTATPLQPQLTLRGSYRYQADAATFTECGTGLSFAVLPGPGAHAVEQAYLKGRGTPGEPLLVALEGRLTETVAMEGEPQLAIEVTRFVQRLPEPECGAVYAPRPLAGTQWVAVQLGGMELGAEVGRRPSLQFDAEQQRVSGFTGCNRLGGSYEIDEAKLAFDELAATRMACPGAAVLEVTFTDALKNAAGYAVIGDQLELYNAAGTLLVRFEAVASAQR